MNWIQELSRISLKDPYSQYGESIYLKYILDHISGNDSRRFIDIGAGDGFDLSNSRFFADLGWDVQRFDKITGQFITVENVMENIEISRPIEIVSIDIDGNDYWVLSELLRWISPTVIIAEFNAHYTDARAIVYDPDFEWGRDSYYGFTFEAGMKLAEKFGYKVIFQNNDLNMYFVRKHLVELPIPEITYNKLEVFPMSQRKDWIYVN